MVTMVTKNISYMISMATKKYTYLRWLLWQQSKVYLGWLEEYHPLAVAPHKLYPVLCNS